MVACSIKSDGCMMKFSEKQAQKYSLDEVVGYSIKVNVVCVLVKEANLGNR